MNKMIQQKIYRYMGTNGILDSLILLPGISYVPRYRLIAEEGKILVNSISNYRTSVIDVAEEEVANWNEIDKNPGQE